MISRKARTDNGKVSIDLESDASSNPDFPRKAVFLLMIIFAHTSRRFRAQSTHGRTDGRTYVQLVLTKWLLVRCSVGFKGRVMRKKACL